MSYRGRLAVALTLAAAVGGGALAMRASRPPISSKAERSGPTPSRLAAAVATPLRDEVTSLGRELQRLKQEHQLLRINQREPAEVDEPQIPSEPARPRRIIPAEYATELQQLMDRDAIDQKAVEAQEGIVTAFRGEALLRSELIDVECRETLCRVEYEHEDAEAHQQFREGIRRDAAFQNVMLFMMPTDELRLRHVMFVAREGEVLPNPASD